MTGNWASTAPDARLRMRWEEGQPQRQGDPRTKRGAAKRPCRQAPALSPVLRGPCTSQKQPRLKRCHRDLELVAPFGASDAAQWPSAQREAVAPGRASAPRLSRTVPARARGSHSFPGPVGTRPLMSLSPEAQTPCPGQPRSAAPPAETPSGAQPLAHLSPPGRIWGLPRLYFKCTKP